MGSASDWLKILIQEHYWDLGRQAGISALVSHTLFRRETSDGIAKCRMVSQATIYLKLLFVRQVKDASFWLEQHLNGVLDETTVTRKDPHNYQQLYIPRETWTKSRSQLLALEKAKFIKIIKNVWKQTTCFSYHQRLKNKLEDLFWNKLYKGIATKLHIY